MLIYNHVIWHIHTCVRLRRKHDQGKGCEQHKENDVDKQVEKIEPQPKVKPLVLQQAADHRMGQHIQSPMLDL